jgi:hypothetical protein
MENMLDIMATQPEFGPDDVFHMEGDKPIHTPGPTPPPKLLKGRIMRSGKDLAHVIEHHLEMIYVAGESRFQVYKKKIHKDELGHHLFDADDL